MPHLHPDAVRVEIECKHSRTGLTSFPGGVFALSREQLVNSAVYAHEERCGRCSTEHAHQQGDLEIRAATDQAWDDLLIAAQRRYDHEVRN
jgi:hypothetical protein